MISIVPSRPVSELLAAYCFGRVLAERFGTGLSCPALRGLIHDAEVAGPIRTGSVMRWMANWPFEGGTGRRLEDAELQVAPTKELQLDGAGFQRWEFLGPVRERILGEWVRPCHSIPVRGEEEFAICLSAPKEQDVDIKSPDPDEKPVKSGCIGEAEIRRLTRVARGAKFVLVVAERDHPVVAAVADLKLPILFAADWEQFLWIRSFSRVAISQHATHWWGAFTGVAKEIYFPRTQKGPWSWPAAPLLVHEPWWHGIDLRVPGDTRFIYEW